MWKSLVILIVGLLVGGLGGWYFAHASAPRFDVPFQTVLLDSGQVYFGRISGLGTDYPVLRDVYYIQSTTNPETKQVSNVLIRRGNEWHGPDFTVVNARHIVMIEPVGANSKVAQLIAEQEKKK
jgi:ABC-type xylose transport system permease subunit